VRKHINNSVVNAIKTEVHHNQIEVKEEGDQISSQQPKANPLEEVRKKWQEKAAESTRNFLNKKPEKTANEIWNESRKSNGLPYAGENNE
jgi:hypothetical protein